MFDGNSEDPLLDDRSLQARNGIMPMACRVKSPATASDASVPGAIRVAAASVVEATLLGDRMGAWFRHVSGGCSCTTLRASRRW
jgi:hypothetical protein